MTELSEASRTTQAALRQAENRWAPSLQELLTPDEMQRLDETVAKSRYGSELESVYMTRNGTTATIEIWHAQGKHWAIRLSMAKGGDRLGTPSVEILDDEEAARARANQAWSALHVAGWERKR